MKIMMDKRKMIQISCNSVEDIPKLEKIKAISTESELVLLFPKEQENLKTNALNKLKKELEGFLVSNKQDSIAIEKLITKSIVLKHSALVVTLLKEYRNKAEMLVRKLAQKFDLIIDENYPMNTFNKFKEGIKESPRGKLDEIWDYYFHGFECRFTNKKTSHQIEVILTFANEYGALDAAFFGKYIKTHPDYSNFPFNIRHEFHDGYIILQVLKEEGIILPISNDAKAEYEVGNGEIHYMDRHVEGIALKPGI